MRRTFVAALAGLALLLVAGPAQAQPQVKTMDITIKSGNEDIAAKFLQASFKGWIFCRDNQSQCVDIVLKAGTTLGKGHMTWQLNEINALIWPSPNGIGVLDKAAWDQTVNISTTYQVLKSKPTDAAFRTDLAKKAADALKSQGQDVNGTGFKKATVQVTPGGN